MKKTIKLKIPSKKNLQNQRLFFFFLKAVHYFAPLDKNGFLSNNKIKLEPLILFTMKDKIIFIIKFFF
jgi:hypothetical protein